MEWRLRPGLRSLRCFADLPGSPGTGRERQQRTFADGMATGSNCPMEHPATAGASFRGRKRGIFVLVSDGIAENNTRVDTLALSQSAQQITNPRRIGFLVYPGCEILDVCGPHDAFFYADAWLTRFGRTSEPGYQCVVIAAAPGPVRTKCGIEIAPTHTFDAVGDNLDTLVVAGGCSNVEEACEDPTLVEWVRSMAPRARRVASICTGTFILAAAGLLNHRRVTTHWMFSELFSRRHFRWFGSIRLFFSLAMEISILQAGSPPESIWPSPYLKKISVRQSLWPSPGQWLFFLAAQEDSLNLAPMWNTTRLGPNGQTSMNSWPGFWAIRGRI